jgi:hypothetical protein
MDRFGGWTTNFLVINKGRLAIGWPNWSGHLSMEFGTPFEWETSGFMGFHFEKRVFYVIIPFWFLTVLSTLVLWVLWRMSRPTPGRFPVTMNDKTGGL